MIRPKLKYPEVPSQEKPCVEIGKNIEDSN